MGFRRTKRISAMPSWICAAGNSPSDSSSSPSSSLSSSGAVSVSVSTFPAGCSDKCSAVGVPAFTFGSSKSSSFGPTPRFPVRLAPARRPSGGCAVFSRTTSRATARSSFVPPCFFAIPSPPFFLMAGCKYSPHPFLEQTLQPLPDPRDEQTNQPHQPHPGEASDDQHQPQRNRRRPPCRLHPVSPLHRFGVALKILLFPRRELFRRPPPREFPHAHTCALCPLCPFVPGAVGANSCGGGAASMSHRYSAAS